MTLSTSKNLTILGICTIIGVIATALAAYFDGNPSTTVDIGLTIAGIMSGVGMIMAKGSASTGGTVDGSGNPVPPTPPAP